MMKKLLAVLSVILFCSALNFAQTLSLDTYGVSPRDVAADPADIFDRAYNSLDNVGVETKTYFVATIGEDPALNILANLVWNLKSRPVGSVAALGATADIDAQNQVISFIPDIAGTYVIEVADGTNTLEYTINAGTYVGLEGGNCTLCHSEKVAAWEETGHYLLFEEAMAGTASSHYSTNCIGCHTTGYDINAANNGFDDRNWIFPAVLGPDTWDQLLLDFPDAMKLARIQCESCHGPGFAHGGATSMSTSISTENCAWCHDSGTHHVYPEQWDHSGHDATEFDGRGLHGGHSVGAFRFSTNRTSCTPCHSGAGHIQWIKEGRPTNSTGLPAAIATLPETPTTITCATCHDPHSVENTYQLRTLETTLGDGTVLTEAEFGTGVSCMVCHRARRNAPTYANDINNASSHFGPHYGAQSDMLLGKNAPDFGFGLPTSPHAYAVENTCVGCHMYMKDGEKADENGNILVVGGHSFNMNDANGNDHVEACAPCHGDIGERFSDKKYYVNGIADLDGDGVDEGLQEEVHGLMEQLAELLPHDVDGNVSITGDGLTVADMMAGYVYFWIEDDRSFGIHNPAFTWSLLKAAIELKGGVTSVDYPKDQSIPAEFNLAQNYPNPFNPTTNIRFSIPQNGNVRLAVYDALGREVALLVDQNMSAGTHEAIWNAQNMSSGVYFYKIQVDNFVQVKKMLLMK